MSVPSNKQQQSPPAKKFGLFRCCIVAVLLLMTLSVASMGGCYYALFNTSLPLAMIKSMLEQSGDVSVNGLTGTINSGFHIDKLRFKSGEQWSEIRDIDFEFNGLMDLMRNNKLVVEEFTVGSGEIYVTQAKSDEDEKPGENPNREFEDAPDESPESGRTAQASANGSSSEFRVKLFELKDLVFIDQVTGTRFRIDQIRVDDFQILNGEITRLGDIQVRADNLDFDAQKSRVYADEPEPSRRFVGKIGAAMHENILQDIGFQLDVCFKKDRIILEGNAFGDHLRLGVTQSEERYEFRDFKFSDFCAREELHFPSRVDGEFWRRRESRDANQDAKGVDQLSLECSKDAQISFGQTAFRIASHDEVWQSNKPLAIQLEPIDPDTGYHLNLKLLDSQTIFTFSADDGTEPREIAAKIWYGQSSESLTEEQLAKIDRLIGAAEKQQDEVEDPAVEPLEAEG